MLRNYITTAWRNIRRNPAITWVNIIGLSLGITCSIALFQWMQYGLAFNTHHENMDRIFRIVTENNEDGQLDTTPGVPPPMADAIRSDVSGIQSVVFFSSIYQDMLLRVTEEDQQVFHELDDPRAFVEAEYFDVFTRPLLQGSVAAFDQPNKVVISEKMRERLFGDNTDVIGRELEVNKDKVYEVIAVMENYPNTTDFPFDILFSYSTFKTEYLEETGWGSVSSDDQVYLMLEEDVSPERIQAQMPEFVLKYFGEEEAEIKKLIVQPMSDFHYDSRWSTYSYNTMTKNELITMGLISFFLVLSAAVNFVNLSTALATRRARETGIRKVLGSGRSQLIWQFMGETFMIVLISLLLSLGLAEILIIQMNKLFESEIVINYTVENITFFLSLLVFVTFFAGLYPALVLSGYKPVEALRSKLTNKREGWFSLRKGLVATQFFISQLFIIGTLILISQLNYLEKMDLGYSADAVLNIPLPDQNHSKKRPLKDEIAQIPGVEMTSLIFSTPLSGSVSVTNFYVEDSPDDFNAAVKLGDENYLSMYGIELLRGDGLVESDTINRLVVNEEWLKVTGLSIDDAVGKQARVWGRNLPITGVVKNFHTVSAHDQLQPIMIMTSINSTRELSIKVEMSRVEDVLRDVETTWKKFYPEYTFDYEFVEDYVARFYEMEQEASMMISFFSMVAIGIGCLGLLGLVAYTTNRRTKEIGVRKVHGASIFQIFSMLSGDVLKLVMVAFVFSAPITWYLMTLWLENYSYHIPLNIGFLLVGLVITLVIAIVTIAFRTYRAAAANPAYSLRSE